jgi:H+/Cl- antiporter ClcA
MVGMGTMVGGGTGAAMTVVTIIFEMTRDYDIVLPMLLAVALRWNTTCSIKGEHLHAQARPSRPYDSEGAARQYVLGASRVGGDGKGRLNPASRDQL